MLQLLSKLRPQSLKEFGWMAASQLIVFVLGVVTIKLLATMGTTEYGRFALALSLAGLLNAVLYSPVENAFARFYYDYATQHAEREFIGIMYRFLKFSALGILILTAVFIGFIGITGARVLNVFSQDFPHLALSLSTIAVFSVLICSVNSPHAILNMMRHRNLTATVQVAEKSLLLIGAWVVILFFYIDAQVALSIQVACYTLTFWLRIVFLEKNLPKMNEAKPLQLQAAMQQRLTTYSIPNGIWGLFYWLQMGGERWMIEYFLTTSDVGIYSLMVNIGNVGVITTYMLVTQFIQPMVFEKFSDMTDAAKFQQGFKFIWAYTLVMIIIVITFVAITALFSTQMLLALSRPDFVAAAHLLPIICGGLGCFAISQTLTMTGQALGQPQAYLKTRLSISVLGIVLNFFGCKYFGLLGIGLSSIVSNLIGVCLILLINRQLLKKQIQLNSVLM